MHPCHLDFGGGRRPRLLAGLSRRSSRGQAGRGTENLHFAGQDQRVARRPGEALAEGRGIARRDADRAGRRRRRSAPVLADRYLHRAEGGRHHQHSLGLQAVLQDIERAHAAGIPFVTMDQIPAETNTVDFHIGADPDADGMHAGQMLAKLVGDKPTTVLDLVGALSAFNGMGRDRGFKEGIADHPNIKIVSEVLTEWHPEPVLAGMENALQAHPDLGAVFAASDGFLPPIWSALQKANRYVKVGTPGHVIVESVDGDEQGCAAVRDGWMDAGYAQPFEFMTRETIGWSLTSPSTTPSCPTRNGSC